MSWLLLIIAAILIGIGVEALLLSQHRTTLPQREVEKLVFGDPPPPLSNEARAYMERKVVVRNGGSTRAIGVLFIVLGLVLGAAGAGVV